MTDRELLELAAKAADIFLTPESLARAFPKWKWDKDFELRHEGDLGVSGAVLVYDYDGKLSGTTREAWSPLADDGDALRLAVRLRLHARQFPIADDGFDAPLGMVEVWRVDDDDPMHVEFLRSGDDRLVVTRRAITRAAAEIGRQMP